MKLENALYIVATPIGNLGDITLRAIETLKFCDLIAAEDTRHSGRLLQHFDINTRVMAYHDHSSEEQLTRILDKIVAGESVALISDAGTPLISDPGYRLVHQARALGIRVVPIPGACAVIAALSASGLPSDRFVFEGFSPSKSGARRAVYENIKSEARTSVFYESPHRILDALDDMEEVFGSERDIVLAREITKTYETILAGRICDVISALKNDSNQQKGEMVVLIKGYVAIDNDTVPPEAQRIMGVLLAELPVKQASSLGSAISGIKKNKLYQWALSADNE